MVPAFRLMQDRIDQINRVLREQITGIRVVRAFVREPQESDRFAAANADLTEVSLRAGRLMSSMFPTVNLLINISSVAVLWIGADRIASGELQVGSLVAYLSYLVQILMSVVMATFMVVDDPAGVGVVRSHRGGARHRTVRRAGRRSRSADVRRARRRSSSATSGSTIPGAEHPVLTDISFTHRAGTDDGDRRQHRRGQDDARQPHPAAVRRHRRARCSSTASTCATSTRRCCGARSGSSRRSRTCSRARSRRNLRFGKPDATDDEMWEALEVAQAADFVRAMPDGLDGAIEQGGTNVSGGQRQRLAIARALVRKPEIYVFDDSFSALDLATDARLRAALVPYTREAAVVIVAQRVSTISTADHILVLEDGADRRRGHPRRAASRLPDLRGDRAVPDR